MVVFNFSPIARREQAGNCLAEKTRCRARHNWTKAMPGEVDDRPPYLPLGLEAMTCEGDVIVSRIASSSMNR